MLGALKNIAKYKIENDPIVYFPYKEDAPDIAVWWRENKNFVIGKKIPVIILEEIYGIENSEKYQHISGLHLIYFLRDNKYNGPILVISIFNLSDVKGLVKIQNTRFREKTERILYTSNLFFVQTSEKVLLGKEIQSFIKFPEIAISNFTREDLLRYSISNKAATEQLFHDLKNSISIGKFDFDSQIHPFLEKIKNDYLDANSVVKYQKIIRVFEREFKLVDSESILMELTESLKKELFTQKIILDISNVKQNDTDNLSDKIRNEQWEVLVIEDNIELGEIIKENFIKLGFKSELAKNYNEALSFCTTLDNLIWIVSDYRLYKHNTDMGNNEIWQTLQGTDLLIELYDKLDDKRVHLSILTSKRDVLNRAVKENWNPPITFFSKRLLSESVGFEVFVETQFTYLDKINESNKSRFIPPESWKMTKDITFIKNSKTYKYFKNKSGIKGADAVKAFKVSQPDEYDNATWLSNWNYLKSMMIKDNDWNTFNNSINEEISLNYRGFRDNDSFWQSLPPENFLGLLNRNKAIEYKSKMRGRLIYRRILLKAALDYRETLNQQEIQSIKKKKFLKNAGEILGINGSIENFCDATGFWPDEIFDSELNVNKINLPDVERAFLKFIKIS